MDIANIVNVVFFVSLIIAFIASMTSAFYENAYKVPKFEKSLNTILVISTIVLFISSVMAIHYV
jgi:fructose-specific phosphotransferase system IIC component